MQGRAWAHRVEGQGEVVGERGVGARLEAEGPESPAFFLMCPHHQEGCVSSP